jgi:hypothetical protein
MPKPFVLHHAIRLTTALALLAAVMTSPIRPSKAAGGGSHPDCLRRNFGIPAKADTAHRPASPVPSRVVQVKALSSERRLDLTGDSARQYVDPACPSPASPEPERDSTAFRLDRAIHPLRC